MKLEPFRMCFACSLQKFSSMFSLLFASFRFQFFTSLQQGYFHIEAKRRENVFLLQNKQNRSLLLWIFRFRFTYSHYFASKLLFKKNLFLLLKKKKPLTFDSNFSFTLESERKIHFWTFPCRNTCRRPRPCMYVHARTSIYL